jgi:hypothetical protein
MIRVDMSKRAHHEKWFSFELGASGNIGEIQVSLPYNSSSDLVTGFGRFGR